MVKAARKKAARHDPSELRGWQQIAGFLGAPTVVVQRWAAQGMPVRRQGRYVTTTADELNQWLGRESGKPVHVATDSTNLTAELKRGISFLRRQHRGKAANDTRKSDRSAKRKSH